MKKYSFKPGDIVELLDPDDSFFNEDFYGRQLVVQKVHRYALEFKEGCWPKRACKLVAEAQKGGES